MRSKTQLHQNVKHRQYKFGDWTKDAIVAKHAFFTLMVVNCDDNDNNFGFEDFKISVNSIWNQMKCLGRAQKIQITAHKYESDFVQIRIRVRTNTNHGSYKYKSGCATNRSIVSRPQLTTGDRRGDSRLLDGILLTNYSWSTHPTGHLTFSHFKREKTEMLKCVQIDPK